MLRAMSARLAVVLAIMTAGVAARTALPAPIRSGTHAERGRALRGDCARAIRCIVTVVRSSAGFRTAARGTVKEVTGGGGRPRATLASCIEPRQGDERCDAVVVLVHRDCAAFADCVVGNPHEPEALAAASRPPVGR
jgi:hypothetical protein